jgi:hypothetical protein
MEKRIITRPDFDGVVCAVLLKEALGGQAPVKWVQPNEIQNNAVDIRIGDVVANLPMPQGGRCDLWFDHHVSNKIDTPPDGIFRIAPSAAGLVDEYFQPQLGGKYRELVLQADKIDSAQLNLDEILHPENYPYVLLSMTVFTHQPSDLAYCDHLVALLREKSVRQVLEDQRVSQRCDLVVAANKAYEGYLRKYTTLQSTVSITDFRGLSPAPDGNRFLIYSLFPQAVVNVKVFNERSQTVIKLGHSILNHGCNVNVGGLLTRYGGGGHRGAGACRIDPETAERCLKEIVQTLIANKSDND